MLIVNIHVPVDNYAWAVYIKRPLHLSLTGTSGLTVRTDMHVCTYMHVHEHVYQPVYSRCVQLESCLRLRVDRLDRAALLATYYADKMYCRHYFGARTYRRAVKLQQVLGKRCIPPRNVSSLMELGLLLYCMPLLYGGSDFMHKIMSFIIIINHKHSTQFIVRYQVYHVKPLGEFWLKVQVVSIATPQPV